MAGPFRSIGEIAAGMVRSREFERLHPEGTQPEGHLGAAPVGTGRATLTPESTLHGGGRVIPGGPVRSGPSCGT